MTNAGKKMLKGAAPLALALLLSLPAHAADQNNYCITPSFLAPDMKSNLLLMIDNSASMYDLSYVDEGYGTRQGSYCYDQTYRSKFCSNNVTQSCSANSDCGTGGTCTQYTGYFTTEVKNADETTSPVYYEYDLTDKSFKVLNSFPSSCTKLIPNTLCVDLDTSTPRKVTRFAAKGSYLNWLTASKFDIQKQVLTGGKYVVQAASGSDPAFQGLVPETRGCVGRGFIKEPLTASYSNVTTSNTALGLTFIVRGKPEVSNPAAPSQGAQTLLEIYDGDYREDLCQAAIQAIGAGAVHSEIRTKIAACLESRTGRDTSVETKEKVLFNQAVQECWQYKTDGTVGNDAISTARTKCLDIYRDASIGGPAGITAGHPATVCNSTYVGQCYTAGSSTPWGNEGTTSDNCIRERHNAYCGTFYEPQVVDPTRAPGNVTGMAEYVPPILSDIGVQGQLDKPLNIGNGADTSLTVRLTMGTAPTGVIQDFQNRIRMGVMGFRFLGSSSEMTSTASGGVGIPKVCSNSPERICTVDTDCAPGTCTGTVVAATPTTTAAGTKNYDGGEIKSYIGDGNCSVTTGTRCATDLHCPTDETCVAAGVGNYAQGMVKAINDLRGATWTPFSEAFSSAIGYFAKNTSTAGSSRTDLRVNPSDYLSTLNPSEYTCQKNNILLISDGMSTADVNSGVNTLAGNYNDSDGNVTSATASTRCKYAGSKNLDDLAFLAKSYNINTFNPASAMGTPPSTLQANQYIQTYVVFTGSDTTDSGECAPQTLMRETAENGGTTLKRPHNQDKLREDLKAIFQEVSGTTASGTAASILSNSEGSGANILQAVFYPKKNYGATPVNWIGELQNLWYFIDPFIGRSTVREDTTGVNNLNLKEDYVLSFFFDQSNAQSASYNQTRVRRTRDTDGDGDGDSDIDVITPDQVKALWRAGEKLHATIYSDRNIFTPCITSTCVEGTGLMKFDTTTSADNVTALAPLLQATADEDDKIIRWVQGEDQTGYRARTVSLTEGGTPRVWKLGDIISSTPRLQSTVKLNSYDLPAPSGYGDASYAAFVQQPNYKERGMVYVGANDGMMHAFKLGKLNVTATGDQKATISGSNLGKEVWAFIPKNSLPYLRYLTCKAGSNDAFCANQDYNHLYFVDGSTTVIDASINSCGGGTPYDQCPKDNSAGSNWRTVLIGGMGLGGASKDASSNCVQDADGYCVKTPINGYGLSSYFALDVTDQHFTGGVDPGAPKLMWEFAVDGLGFATTGAATVRVGEKNKNGKWFAVFGSGPTGSIDRDKHQFLGKSNQRLKIFVVDLNAAGPIIPASGANANDKGTKYWEIDTLVDGTTIENAFVGSMTNATIDADRWKSGSSSNYQDDALYFGYVQASATPLTSFTRWRNGGVLRLMTNGSADPSTWKLSKVIDGIGPVTTAVTRLQDRKNHKLWLFFGDGRYYFAGENMGAQRRIYGLAEPCYTGSDALNGTCTTKRVLGDLANQTDINSATATVTNGWYINLAERDTTNNMGAERVITDPVALTNGAVFFTTFMPTGDPCKFGGNSFLWATRYDTGLRAPAAALEGKALVQVSTGSFEEINLNTAFNAQGGRKTSLALTGKPPSDPPPIVSKSNLKPVKRIIQIQER